MGCISTKILKTNCNEYVSNEDSIENDYTKWEDCLVQQKANNNSKQDLYQNISGKLISQSLLEGYSGGVSQSYLSFKALTTILSDDEISDNLQSSDSGIKYNAFYTIAKRKNPDVFESLTQVLSDTTKVYSQIGCLVDEMTLSDLCINLVLGIENYEDLYKLNKYEIAKLDSIVMANEYEIQYAELIKF